jgi:hypothetical protein
MPLIHPSTDPRRFDSRLFKGGDPSRDMRAQEQERQAKVNAAVDAINARFGIAPASSAVAPTREAFMRPGAPTQMTQRQHGEGGDIYDVTAAGPAVFDEAGFNQATAQYHADQGGASGAKAARESMYAGIGDAVTQTAMRDLDRQHTAASRKNKFGLARNGLMGGSVDAESAGELTELYGEGQLKAAGMGSSAASDLRMADEKTRQNLISLAQSGLDVGTASSLAAGQMAGAADVAKANATSATVGQMFDNMGQAYLMNQVLKGRQAGATTPAASGYGSSGLFTGKNYTGRATA